MDLLAALRSFRDASGSPLSVKTRSSNAAELKTSSVLGRLTITPFGARTNQAGEQQEILVLGGRSFSIWSEDGQQVYDSGSDFERITARLNPLFFNASNDNNNLDDRSDNKGPSPPGSWGSGAARRPPCWWERWSSRPWR